MIRLQFSKQGLHRTQVNDRYLLEKIHYSSNARLNSLAPSLRYLSIICYAAKKTDWSVCESKSF